MKKLIAILAVFAFLGAALFAQEDTGTWSLGGKGQIGTVLNLRPIFTTYAPGNLRQEHINPPPAGSNLNPAHPDHVLVGGTAWDDWDKIKGTLDLNYRKGGLALGISFDTTDMIGASLSFNGENFTFEASQKLDVLVAGANAVNSSRNTNNDGKLWGNYRFLDGKLKLEVAQRNEGQQWNSSGVIGDTWTHHDQIGSRDYLLIDFAPIEGLNVGFKLPNLFSGIQNNPNGPYTAVNTGGDNQQTDYVVVNDFMDASLRRMVFGAKYASGPFNAAFQFGLRNYMGNSGWNRIYVGAEYKINDQMTAGFAVHGELGKVRTTTGLVLNEDDPAYDPDDSTTWIVAPTFNKIDPDATSIEKMYLLEDRAELRIGGEFTYNASPLNVRLRLIYFNEEFTYRGGGDSTRFISPYTGEEIAGDIGIEGGKLRIEPRVFYDVIPESLRVQLTTRFEIPLGRYTNYDVRIEEKNYTGDMKYPKPNLYYEITPELFFNFLGTGAGNWDTGFAVHYRIAGYAEANAHRAHALSFHFKWKF